jgi:hypothetical protein
MTDVPLTEEPGPIPAEPQFHQYIIAIGAVGETPVPISMILHDLGMKFAQENGLDPLLCVGYVTPSAFRPDYLSAAEIWHSMSKEDREGLKEWGPRLYVALSLLFGTHGH